VRAAASRLGYRASAVARALRTQQSFAIGVLMADVSNSSFPDFVRGIEDVAQAEGYNLLLCNTDDVEEKQLQEMQTLIDRRVDGMVLLSQHTRSAAVRALLEVAPPYVLIQRRTASFNDDYVGSDTRSGIAALVAHLADLGHRRVAFIHGPVESSIAQDKFQSFTVGRRRYGFDSDPDLVHMGDYSEESGHAALGRFMSLARPPTAIIASNDVNALGVLAAAAKAGVRVPEDLSVAGFDDIALASHPRIDLTTVRQPKREMGRAAAQLLIKRMRAKRTTRGKEIIFPTALVTRGSTAPPRGQVGAAKLVRRTGGRSIRRRAAAQS
jgi:LacI family transcriptional regulator